MNNCWIQTYTGRMFRPFAPDPRQIDIVDIAHALANLCRFTGHVRQFYSVAEHSVRVAWAADREVMPWALMHDAAEAYINDIVRPIKQNALFNVGGVAVDATEAEDRILSAIAERFGLPWPMPESIRRQVKEIDNRILLTEKRDLMSNSPAPWDVQGEPFDWHITKPWGPQEAEQRFLAVANDVGIPMAIEIAAMTFLAIFRPAPPSESILAEAAQITSADRRQAYGHPTDNFNRIADIWTVVLADKLRDDAAIEANDVGRCMIGLKLARECHAHKRDNLVDIAGYARTLAIVEGDEE